jgi:hypothetical protein
MGQALFESDNLSGLITSERDSGNGYHIVARSYPSGDAEVCAVRIESSDQLRRGGGAVRQATSRDDQSDEVKRRASARARKKIRRLCQTACFDRMLTLTFRENVTDRKEAWKKFHYFNKLMRWRFKEKWFYVVVPELQKRGAVHFHLAVRGWFHVQTVRRFWHRAVGELGGNVDITSPRKANGKNSWNPRHISNYLAKYVAKEVISDFNGKRYASGGHIQVPEPLTGWVGVGISVIPLLMDVLKQLTRVPHQYIYEGEHRFYLFYVST